MNGDLEKFIKKGEEKKEIGIEELKKEASALEEKIYTTRKNDIEEIIKKIKEGHDVKEIMKRLEKEDKEKIRGSAKKIIEEKLKKKSEKKEKFKKLGMTLMGLIFIIPLLWVILCNKLAEIFMNNLENMGGSFK
jgi:formate dehydrogenase maturation protein FdhE